MEPNGYCPVLSSDTCRVERFRLEESNFLFTGRDDRHPLKTQIVCFRKLFLHMVDEIEGNYPRIPAGIMCPLSGQIAGTGVEPAISGL